MSSELTVAEMKTLWEAEKQRIIQDMKVAHAKDIEKSISETKKKQWVSIETIHNRTNLSYSWSLFAVLTTCYLMTELSCTMSLCIFVDLMTGLSLSQCYMYLYVVFSRCNLVFS